MTAPQDFQTPVTVDVFDQRAQQHEFELRRAEADARSRVATAEAEAKAQRTEARMVALQYFIVCLFIASILFGVGLWIWSATNDPEPGGMSKDERRETACVNNGGGWVPEALLARSSDGLCVYPGKSAAATGDK